MRKFLIAATVIAVGIVGVVVLLAVTPVGFRLASGFAERAVESNTGLTLDIGSFRGNLLSRVVLRDVSLSVPRGPALVMIEHAEADYDLPALVTGGGLVADLRIDGASVMIERAGDALVGWEEFARRARENAAADSLSDERGLEYAVRFSARDVAVAYRDTARGTEVLARSLSADADASKNSYRAAIECSLSMLSSSLASPLDGALIVSLAGEGSGLEIREASLRTDVFELEASGVVGGGPGTAGADGGVSGAPGAEGADGGASPELHVRATSRIDLEAALAKMEAVSGDVGSATPATADDATGAASRRGAARARPQVKGILDVAAEFEGTVASPSYRVIVSSADVSADGVRLSDLEASFAGDPAVLKLESLRASLFEGSLRAEGTVDLARAGSNTSPFAYELRATAERLNLSELARSVPSSSEERRPDLDGTLSISAVVSGLGASTAALEGTFDAAVQALSVDGREPGDLVLGGRLEDGSLTVAARCCSTHVRVAGDLSNRGVDALTFSVECRDLSGPGALFGVEELAGSLSADGTLLFREGEPSAILDVRVPDGSYAGVLFGPAAADVEWSREALASDFSAFGGAVAGRADASSGAGTYTAHIALDGLDLASVVPDSIREAWALDGTVSGHASIEGDTSSVLMCEGEITGLELAARGHEVKLDAPFAFRAAGDTVHISDMSLTGDFGAISASGRLGAGDDGRISAHLRSVDVSALADLVPSEDAVPVGGTLEGTVSVEGNLSRPSFVADVSIEGLSVAGIVFDSVTLYAEGDTSDLVFDVTAESSASGSIGASGSVPLATSAGGLPAFDVSREFGLSVVCDDLQLDLGSDLLPTVRGTRRLSAVGSVLLTGRADSLSSVNGRGSFDRLSATFDLLNFSVSDTLEFDVDGGTVDVPLTTVSVTRRRVLGDEGGGRIEFRASIGSDGSLAGAASARGAEVARLVRTFAPRAGAPVRGEIDVDAVIGGTVTEPVVDLAWQMEDPVISGLALGLAEGNATLSSDRLVISGASLWAGDRSVNAAGVVPFPTGSDGGDVAELDLRVWTDAFELGAMRPVDPAISRLRGVLDADLRITGSPESPRLEGEMSLRDGSFKGHGLTEPVRDINVSLAADGTTVALNEVVAAVGGGSVSAVGFVVMDPGAAPTFWLKTKLDSPEIAVDDMFEARLSGHVVWAGSAGRSQLTGAVSIDEALVSYNVGLSDLLERRPVRVIVRRPDDTMANTTLDVEVNAADKISIENNVAKIDLRGGIHLGGTLDAPSISGGFYAEEGQFRFLKNEFQLESLGVAFMDPRRRDPHIDLTGVADVTDRSGEEYVVTVRVQGYARDVVPELVSDPPLSEPDIASLLTFGATTGMLVGGGDAAGSSGDRFGSLARNAFLSRAFGVAESALERLLRLDTVALDDEAIADGDATDADVTLGKEFGDRLRVNYTTAVGRLDERQIEVAFDLAKYLALETRADREGNHAIDLRLRIPFR